MMQFSRNRETNHQNDEAFLTLLSSQRELLNQLKRETATYVGKKKNFPSGGRFYSSGGIVEATKTEIERRSSIDLLLSKRLSLDLSTDNFALPGISYDSAMGDLSFQSMRENRDHSSEKKRGRKGCDSYMDAPVKRKKRRLSSLGFLKPSFFEDHLEVSSRRNSIVSVTKPEDPVKEEFKMELVAESKKDPEATSKDDSAPASDLKHAEVGPEKMKRTMVAFRDAMAKSQESQQSIHDWDRKMGLKRSHSKTMRSTTRSRKKLRSILKAEITAMATHN